jgi:hypothetical protein
VKIVENCDLNIDPAKNLFVASGAILQAAIREAKRGSKIVTGKFKKHFGGKSFFVCVK